LLQHLLLQRGMLHLLSEQQLLPLLQQLTRLLLYDAVGVMTYSSASTTINKSSGDCVFGFKT
jgi:hypothetical protein